MSANIHCPDLERATKLAIEARMRNGRKKPFRKKNFPEGDKISLFSGLENWLVPLILLVLILGKTGHVDDLDFAVIIAGLAALFGIGRAATYARFAHQRLFDSWDTFFLAYLPANPETVVRWTFHREGRLFIGLWIESIIVGVIIRAVSTNLLTEASPTDIVAIAMFSITFTVVIVATAIWWVRFSGGRMLAPPLLMWLNLAAGAVIGMGVISTMVSGFFSTPDVFAALIKRLEPAFRVLVNFLPTGWPIQLLDPTLETVVSKRIAVYAIGFLAFLLPAILWTRPLFRRCIEKTSLKLQEPPVGEVIPESMMEDENGERWWTQLDDEGDILLVERAGRNPAAIKDRLSTGDFLHESLVAPVEGPFGLEESSFPVAERNRFAVVLDDSGGGFWRFGWGVLATVVSICLLWHLLSPFGHNTNRMIGIMGAVMAGFSFFPFSSGINLRPFYEFQYRVSELIRVGWRILAVRCVLAYVPLTLVLAWVFWISASDDPARAIDHMMRAPVVSLVILMVRLAIHPALTVDRLLAEVRRPIRSVDYFREIGERVVFRILVVISGVILAAAAVITSVVSVDKGDPKIAIITLGMLAILATLSLAYQTYVITRYDRMRTDLPTD